MTAPLYSIVFSAPLASTVANGVVGDVLIGDSTSTALQFVLANTANRGTRLSTGIALSDYSAGGVVQIQQEGQVDAATSGISVGTASYVRVSTAGRLERVTTPTTSDDVVGWADADGTTHLRFGQAPGGYAASQTAPGSDKSVIFNNGGVLAGSLVATIDEVGQGFAVTANAQATLIRVINYAGASTNGANIVMQKARGTSLVPTRALSGDQLGGFSARGYVDDGASPGFFPSTANAVRCVAEEDYTSTAQGSAWAFLMGRKGTTQTQEAMRINGNGLLTLTGRVATTGTVGLISATGGVHTNQTASTENNEILFDMSATLQFATGALTTQRTVLIKGRTYRFVGASTITNAATFVVDQAPLAGTNATITNRYALWVQADRARLDGGATSGAVILGEPNMSSPYGVHGDTTQAVADSGTTTLAAAVYAYRTIFCTGALTASRPVVFPAPSASGAYDKLVVNNCTGAGIGITVGTGSGSTVYIPNGQRARVLFTSAGASFVAPVINGATSKQLFLSPVDGAVNCGTTNANNETHGFRFFPYGSMTVVGVRVFTGASGSGKTFKVQLWNAAGTSLANASAVASSNNQDLTVLFSSPVVIAGMTSATDFYQVSTYTLNYSSLLAGASGTNWPPSTGQPFVIAPNVLFKTFSFATGDVVPSSAISSESYAVEPVFA